MKSGRRRVGAAEGGVRGEKSASRIEEAVLVAVGCTRCLLAARNMPRQHRSRVTKLLAKSFVAISPPLSAF